MKMKKLLLILLTLCLVFAVMVSCIEPQRPPVQEPEPTAPPAPPTTPPPQPPTVPPPQPPAPTLQSITLDRAKAHTVVSGETLSSIALQYYGTGKGYYYPLIDLASKLGSFEGVPLDPIFDIDEIEPGWRLAIPDIDTNLGIPAVKEIVRIHMRTVAGINDTKGRPDDAAALRELADSL